MADKVHHWKHGWVPIDAYAAQIKAGKVTGANPAGIPMRHYPDQRDVAVTAGMELQNLVPSIGLPVPHYSPATQDMAGHYTGGLTLSGLQADALLNHLDHVAEYPLTPRQTRMMSGKPALMGTHPEQQARDRARMISGVVNSDVFAHIVGHDNARNQPVFSGGVQLPSYTVDKLLKHLRSHRSGMATVAETAKASGTFKPARFTHHSGSSNPVGKDFRSMTPQAKINAAATMYGAGSPQHKAAQKKFGGPPSMAPRFKPGNRTDTFYGQGKFSSN